MLLTKANVLEVLEWVLSLSVLCDPSDNIVKTSRLLLLTEDFVVAHQHFDMQHFFTSDQLHYTHLFMCAM